MLVRAYVGNALPRDTAVQAIDNGLGLELLADLCAVSGEKNRLDAGLALAESVIACYFDAVVQELTGVSRRWPRLFYSTLEFLLNIPYEVVSR